MVVKTLPSKTKDILMRLFFLPVLTASILIGGETVVLPQVAVRVLPQVVLPQVVLPQVTFPQVVVPQVAVPQVAVPRVVVPQVTFPQVVMPAMVVPYPFFGSFYYNDRRRDVYAYGRRGYESREQAHRGERGARGGRR